MRKLMTSIIYMVISISGIMENLDFLLLQFYQDTH